MFAFSSGSSADSAESGRFKACLKSSATYRLHVLLPSHFISTDTTTNSVLLSSSGLLINQLVLLTEPELLKTVKMAENPRQIKKGKRRTTGDGAKAGSSSVPILGPGLTQADLERAVGFSGGVLINTDLLQMPELPSFQHAPQFQILDSGLFSHASFLTSASDYRRKLREEGADKKGNKMGYFNLDGEKYAELLARQQKHLEGKKEFEWLTKLKEEMAKGSSSDEEDQVDEKDVKLPDFQNFQPLKIPVNRLSEIKKEEVEQELKPAEEESPKSTGSGASTVVVASAEETLRAEVTENKEDLQGGGNAARALEFEEEEEDLTLIVEESVEDLFPH